MSDTPDLLPLAEAAAAQAYAPYSRLQVGCAVLTASGQTYSGCNVENAAYPSGGCAEQHAIAAAVRGDGPAMRLRRVAIFARDAQGRRVAISPCGACRQRLAEFADGDVVVVFADDDEALQRGTLAELLPKSFRFPR